MLTPRGITDTSVKFICARVKKTCRKVQFMRSIYGWIQLGEILETFSEAVENYSSDITGERKEREYAKNLH